jgi:uncharacterized protein YjbJ (UPF0337 family)
MSDRVDELKGTLKEGAGRLTDDKELEAEGRGEKTVARAERKVKGIGNQIKGSIERGVGKMTGHEETEARGAADQLKGDAQRTG